MFGHPFLKLLSAFGKKLLQFKYKSKPYITAKLRGGGGGGGLNLAQTSIWHKPEGGIFIDCCLLSEILLHFWSFFSTILDTPNDHECKLIVLGISVCTLSQGGALN